jgi:hypothetical protein
MKNWAISHISKKLNGWFLKLTECSAGRAAFELAKNQTEMASIFTTWQCGSTHLPYSDVIRLFYRQNGIELVRQIHQPFLVPGRGIVWKMQEDLSGPYAGTGLGALDAFDGYVSYRMLDENALSSEIADMRALIDTHNPDLVITQDLGLGMMLWLSHFFPSEDWAIIQKQRCLEMLDSMWQSEGYVCREPYLPNTKFAFTNYGVSVGLQAIGHSRARVRTLNGYFETYRAGDEYDYAAITHVMACSSHFPGCLIYTATSNT